MRHGRQYVSPTSMSPQRIAKFESAVRCSLPMFLPPRKSFGSEKIMKGNPDPIVALIIVRLTKLVFPFIGGSFLPTWNLGADDTFARRGEQPRTLSHTNWTSRRQSSHIQAALATRSGSFISGHGTEKVESTPPGRGGQRAKRNERVHRLLAQSV